MDNSHDYSIDDGNARLRQVTNQVRCKSCGFIIALEGGNSLLVKGVTIFDTSQKALITKCKQCGSFNMVNANRKKTRVTLEN